MHLLFGLAEAQSSWLLLLAEMTSAALTGGSVSRVLRRERRRRQRQRSMAALEHYVRAMEEFPELTRREATR